MTPTPDTALAARLATMEATSQDHSPFSNLFERALCSAYRSGQLITIADHLEAVRQATENHKNRCDSKT